MKLLGYMICNVSQTKTVVNVNINLCCVTIQKHLTDINQIQNVYSQYYHRQDINRIVHLSKK